jgi:hypothetical protein
MKLRPFQDESQCPWREAAVDSAGPHFYGDLAVAIDGVKMRGAVLGEVHLDDDAKKAGGLSQQFEEAKNREKSITLFMFRRWIRQRTGLIW